MSGILDRIDRLEKELKAANETIKLFQDAIEDSKRAEEELKANSFVVVDDDLDLRITCTHFGKITKIEGLGELGEKLSAVLGYAFDYSDQLRSQKTEEILECVYSV